jgi:hypothetical protein
MKISPPYSGTKSKPSNKPGEAGGKLKSHVDIFSTINCDKLEYYRYLCRDAQRNY